MDLNDGNNLNIEIDSCDNASCMLSIIKKDFEKYKHEIGFFFYGKEKEIKSIYTAIKDNSFPYNKISAVDVNFATHAYADYLEGLIQFSHKMLSLRETDEIEQTKIESTIHAVAEKDNLFIESLFGGEKNPVKEMDIDTAMKNIECLINIDNDFSHFCELGKTLCLVYEENMNDKYKIVILEGLKVFFKSIIHYNQKCVESVLSTYKDIRTSMEKRTPAHGEVEVPKYQLF